MSNFEIDNEIRLATSMDAPLTRGPTPRWQRKNMESSTASINASMNASLNLYMSASESITTTTVTNSNSIFNISAATNSGNSKTPSKTPTRRTTTPSRAENLLLKSSANKRTPKTPGLGPDRFIPNRNAVHMERSHYLINQNELKVEGDDDEGNVNVAMSNQLNGDMSNFRIMSYQDKMPAAAEGHANNLKVLYSSAKRAPSSKKGTRYIPSQPERILDAPDIMNDYYLQLVDWSSTNVLAVALNRELYLWNAASGEIDNLLQLPEGEYISSVAWVQGSNNLAIGTSLAEVQLWDSERCKRLRTLKGHSSRVGTLSWNAHLLSSGSRSGSIFHHDVRISTHHQGTLAGHSQEVCGLKWSPNGQYLASGGNDNTVNVWSNNVSHDAEENKPVYSFTQHQSAVKAIAWCPWKPNLLATGGGTADRQIRIWNTNNGTCLYNVDTQSQVCALLWSKEYKELVSAHGYVNNELMIWKYPGLTKISELTGHTARILGMVMSPDGSTVVSAGADETLRFWECFQVDNEKKKKAEVKAYKDKVANNPMRLSIR